VAGSNTVEESVANRKLSMYFSIDVSDIPEVSGLKALRLEWWNSESKCRVLRYALNGKEQLNTGICLDIDKCCALDHFDDLILESALQSIIPHLVESFFP
jgi:hypothetical protein